MNREEAKKKLRGPFVPLVTPFKPDLELDLEGLKSNTRFLLESGFKEGYGVFLIACAAGEFQVMSSEERKKVARAVVDEAKGKIPLVLGGQHTDTREVIAIAKYAAEIGIDVIQLSPPYYDPGQSPDDMIRFYKMVNDAADVGIMVYTSWWHGHNFPPELIARLLEIENVISIKYSARNVWEYRHVMMKFADKAAFMDNENLHIMSYMLGATGFLSHPGHFHPRHELELWKHIQKGEYTEATIMLSKLNWPFYDFHYILGQRSGITDANVTKAAVEMVGLAAGPPRPPARPLTAGERRQLREMLESAGVPLK